MCLPTNFVKYSCSLLKAVATYYMQEANLTLRSDYFLTHHLTLAAVLFVLVQPCNLFNSLQTDVCLTNEHSENCWQNMLFFNTNTGAQCFFWTNNRSKHNLINLTFNASVSKNNYSEVKCRKALYQFSAPIESLLPKLRLAMFCISTAFADRLFKSSFFNTVSLKQAWHGCLHPSVQSQCCASRHFRQKWCPQLSVTTLLCTASHFRHLIILTTVMVAISPNNLKIGCLRYSCKFHPFPCN